MVKQLFFSHPCALCVNVQRWSRGWVGENKERKERVLFLQFVLSNVEKENIYKTTFLCTDTGWSHEQFLAMLPQPTVQTC